jgi:hypothetical protein
MGGGGVSAEGGGKSVVELSVFDGMMGVSGGHMGWQATVVNGGGLRRGGRGGGWW